MENVINNIRRWMAKNFLRLNDEFISPSSSAKNIGFFFDKHLNCQKQVNEICKSSWFHLRNIMKIKNYLDKESLERITHAFITSKLDMNNALLYAAADHLKQKLQLVQNAAARMIMGIRKYDHITPSLITLHWLPIKMRILYKILLFTFKALHGMSPSYVSSMITRKPEVRALRSNRNNLLTVPRINNSSHGGCSFQRVAPELWNALPKALRFSEDISSFKKLLKTHMFRKAFNL